MQMTVDSDLSSHSLKGFVLVLRARGNTWTRIQMMFWSNRTAALTAQNMQINFETLSIQKFLLKRNFEGLIITFWRSIVSDRKEEESKKISFETMRHFPHDSCMEFRWLSFPVSLSHSCWAKPRKKAIIICQGSQAVQASCLDFLICLFEKKVLSVQNWWKQPKNIFEKENSIWEYFQPTGHEACLISYKSHFFVDVLRHILQHQRSRIPQASFFALCLEFF